MLSLKELGGRKLEISIVADKQFLQLQFEAVAQLV